VAVVLAQDLHVHISQTYCSSHVCRQYACQVTSDELIPINFSA